MNPPEDLENYEFGQREKNFYRPRYSTITGKFKGLCETLGYIMVRGDADECFLGYSFWKQNSKILRSFYKKRIPSSFSATFFNRHRIQYESGVFKRNIHTLTFFFHQQQTALKTSISIWGQLILCLLI